jgi:hypothetical protein
MDLKKAPFLLKLTALFHGGFDQLKNQHHKNVILFFISLRQESQKKQNFNKS